MTVIILLTFLCDHRICDIKLNNREFLTAWFHWCWPSQRNRWATPNVGHAFIRGSRYPLPNVNSRILICLSTDYPLFLWWTIMLLTILLGPDFWGWLFQRCGRRINQLTILRLEIWWNLEKFGQNWRFNDELTMEFPGNVQAF